MPPPRDFSTISPSAKSLLLLKAETSIPFARRAAECLWGFDGVETAQAHASRTPDHELTVLHFENRYRSLDRLLAESGATRVMELAAGLSFRGLAMAQSSDVFYLDTDLADIIEIKRELLPKLHPTPLIGTLRVEPLDALDPASFGAALDTIPPGPLAIVNEGLLVYLDDAEKARLASNIRAALSRRPGAWITGDVYVKGPTPTSVARDERARQFVERHRIEENKYESWAAAERFFDEQGFSIARKLSPSLHPGHVRESWVLRVLP